MALENAPARPSAVPLAATGLGAGVLSGLLGVGGGIVLVPALTGLFKFPQRAAQATSLVAIIFTAIAGSITYSFAGHFAAVPALLIAAGGIVGSFLGSQIAARLPDRAIRILFALVMIGAAIRMLFPTPQATGAQIAASGAAIAGYLAAGLAMGLLSALVGVGGGVILVPILVLGFQFPAHLAQGTSLLVMIPIAAMGAWQGGRHGHTDYRAGVVLGVGGIVGSPLGALLADSMPTLWLQRVFAVLLLFAAGQMLYLAWRDRSRGARPAG